MAQGSKIIIGGYNLEKYAKSDQSLVWNNLANHYYWTVTLNKVTFKNKDNTSDFDFKTTANQAILDSGTSYILMPVDDYQ
jgi:hypothetical protein